MAQYAPMTNPYEMRGDMWAAHPNILMVDELGMVKMSRKVGDPTKNYFCAMMNQPLKRNVKVVMTVNRICQEDRFIDFGIVPKSKM